MLSGLFYWLRGLAIVEFLIWILRNCWTFIVIFLFWDEINGFMSQFELWRLLMDRIHDAAWDFMNSPLYTYLSFWFSRFTDWFAIQLTDFIGSIKSVFA